VGLRLKNDDEFRHVQAVYNYPWSYDSNHLHTVILEPLTSKLASPRASPATTSVNLSADGRIIVGMTTGQRVVLYLSVILPTCVTIR